MRSFFASSSPPTPRRAAAAIAAIVFVAGGAAWGNASDRCVGDGGTLRTSCCCPRPVEDPPAMPGLDRGCCSVEAAHHLQVPPAQAPSRPEAASPAAVTIAQVVLDAPIPARIVRPHRASLATGPPPLLVKQAFLR